MAMNVFVVMFIVKYIAVVEIDNCCLHSVVLYTAGTDVRTFNETLFYGITNKGLCCHSVHCLAC